ncbi:hypothetical protein PLICRDRAFT_269499 [Plicaturopsis crispa FD-325 SS-3]|nr:hypothetical protein PLICRDRAFT_269499 [Plicaturopsis crispa FD-325 SS-3]
MRSMAARNEGKDKEERDRRVLRPARPLHRRLRARRRPAHLLCAQRAHQREPRWPQSHRARGHAGHAHASALGRRGQARHETQAAFVVAVRGRQKAQSRHQRLFFRATSRARRAQSRHFQGILGGQVPALDQADPRARRPARGRAQRARRALLRAHALAFPVQQVHHDQAHQAHRLRRPHPRPRLAPGRAPRRPQGARGQRV